MRKETLISLIAVLVGISWLPFFWLFTQTAVLGGFSPAFANIAGLTGALLMLWQVLLGNRLIAKVLTQDYVTLIRVHIFLGTYGLFFALTHPMLEMLRYGGGLIFLLLPNLGTQFEQHVTYGRLALYTYLFVWITSAVIRDKIPYRLWQFFHDYLTYPTLAFVFLHATKLGTFLNTVPFIQHYWYGMLVLYIGMVVWRLAQALNIGKHRYVLVDKISNRQGITVYTFAPQGKEVKLRVGQFCFIKPDFFAESHPFTVMRFAEASGQLQFGIKTVGEFTNQLETIEKGQIVYLDGPYGVFTQEGQNSEPKVIIAGGIGITPFVELIRRFGGKNTKLLYANKYLNDAVNRDEFKRQLGANYVELISQEKLVNEPVVQGRLTEQILSEVAGPDFIQSARFFVCGSAGFMAGVFEMLRQLGVGKERIFAEEFSL